MAPDITKGTFITQALMWIYRACVYGIHKLCDELRFTYFTRPPIASSPYNCPTIWFPTHVVTDGLRTTLALCRRPPKTNSRHLHQRYTMTYTQQVTTLPSTGVWRRSLGCRATMQFAVKKIWKSRQPGRKHRVPVMLLYLPGPVPVVSLYMTSSRVRRNVSGLWKVWRHGVLSSSNDVIFKKVGCHGSPLLPMLSKSHHIGLRLSLTESSIYSDNSIIVNM